MGFTDSSIELQLTCKDNRFYINGYSLSYMQVSDILTHPFVCEGIGVFQKQHANFISSQTGEEITVKFNTVLDRSQPIIPQLVKRAKQVRLLCTTVDFSDVLTLKKELTIIDDSLYLNGMVYLDNFRDYFNDGGVGNNNRLSKLSDFLLGANATNTSESSTGVFSPVGETIPFVFAPRHVFVVFEEPLARFLPDAELLAVIKRRCEKVARALEA